MGIYSNQNQSQSTPFYSASEMFFGRNDGRIGGQYNKVMYKEYTDVSFTTKKSQTHESEHLGLFGMDWNKVSHSLFCILCTCLLS